MYLPVILHAHNATSDPTGEPSPAPTSDPSHAPSAAPSRQSTDIPSDAQAREPTENPTKIPTVMPTTGPTVANGSGMEFSAATCARKTFSFVLLVSPKTHTRNVRYTYPITDNAGECAFKTVW